MTLPVIRNAVFELSVPGEKGKKFQYRPFLMSELKALLQAREFGDDASFALTIREVLGACLLGKVDVDKLPVYLVDYLFLMIRAKSVGEVVEAKYFCNNTVEKEISNEDGSTSKENALCGASFSVKINLEKAEIIFPEKFNKRAIIELSDGIGIKFNHPTFKELSGIQLEEDKNSVLDVTNEYVYSCIECVYHNDKILVPGKDFTLEEMQKWFGTFTTAQVREVSEFFTNQPAIGLDLHLKCPACKIEHDVKLRGLSDFFD
jgi:hypothetical protein